MKVNSFSFEDSKYRWDVKTETLYESVLDEIEQADGDSYLFTDWQEVTDPEEIALIKERYKLRVGYPIQEASLDP
jgi:hypothetical protein